MLRKHRFEIFISPPLRCPLGAALVLLIWGCSSPGTQSRTPVQAATIKPVATIQELMQAQVDPLADDVWGSVETIISATGVEERQPQTPEEWAAVRRSTVSLVEAANLLMIEGRTVSRVQFAAEAAGALDSQQIEQRLNANRAAFNQLAAALRAGGLQALAAIDARNAPALVRAGGELDEICEACHVSFWYPNQVIPALPQAIARTAARP